MKTIHHVFVITAVLALTACGGGGGGSSTSSSTQSPISPTAAQNSIAATSGVVVGAM